MADDDWQKLDTAMQGNIFRQVGLVEPQLTSVSAYDELIKALEQCSLSTWVDRIAALDGRFDCARELTAKQLEPKIRAVELPRPTLLTQADVEA